MKPETSLTFLGTSTSTGVPVIGCRCDVCSSGDPRLTRTRSSIHIQTPEFSVLVDSGPDLREQALREKLDQVDAVLYTHAHLDHITGFDELRAYCWHRDAPLPLYGSSECLGEIKRIFSWAFLPTNIYRGYVKPDPIETDGPFTIGKLTVTPVPVETGHKLRAKNVYLTHLSHELDVNEAMDELPENFQFAYDGLKLNFPIIE